MRCAGVRSTECNRKARPMAKWIGKSDLDAPSRTPNKQCNSADRGQLAYEADVAKYPHYHDGRPRKKWSQLSKLAKSRW